MKSVNIIFMQGLGNSIINLPIVLALKDDFDLTLSCFSNGSAQFYESLGFSVQAFKSTKDIFTKSRKVKTDIALTMYPNWKRELAAISSAKADTKMVHSDPNYSLTRFMLYKKHKMNPSKHDLENNIELINEALSVHGEDFDLEGFYKSKGIVAKESSYVIHPTASTPFKFFPVSFWIDVFSSLDEKKPINIFCSSAEFELRFCEKLVNAAKSELKHDVHLHVQADFTKIISYVMGAVQFIGLDSALMHLAALMDKPTLGLWSFANFRRIYPYGNKAKVYIPREVINLKDFEYPKGELPWISRAKASDISNILEGAQEDFQIQPKFKEAVKFFTF